MILRCPAAIAVCLLCVLTSPVYSQPDSGTTVSFQGKTVRFATIDQGKKLIGAADDFVRQFSEFDLAARLNSPQAMGQDKFLTHATAQVQSWSLEDINKLSKVIAEVDARLRQHNITLSLPDEILLIHTSGKEEAGPSAPYTRGQAIVFTGSTVTRGNDQSLTRLYLHELFHVLTRHDPEIRRSLYELIKFKHCGKISYPDQLLTRKLSNPDAYHFDSYVDISAGDAAIKAVPLTLAKKTPYESGGVMGNISIELLELEQSGDQMKAKIVDGQPVLHPISTVAASYIKEIGRNTNYIIHPEEIMAENFAMAVSGRDDAPNPEILSGVIKFFAAPKPDK